MTKILLPASATTRVHRCGFCPRHVIERDEPQGRFTLVDGKVICTICRVLKSKAGSAVRKGKSAFEKDKERAKQHSDKMEFDRIIDIAAASQKDSPETRNKRLKRPKK